MRYSELNEYDTIKDWTGEIRRALVRIEAAVKPKVAELNMQWGSNDSETALGFLRGLIEYSVDHSVKDELLDPEDPAGQQYLRMARILLTNLQLDPNLIRNAVGK